MQRIHLNPTYSTIISPNAMKRSLISLLGMLFIRFF